MRVANGKEDCLLLDFAGNCERHGPVDRVKCAAPGEAGDGEAPVKSCPECMTYVHAAVRICPDCGYEWPAPTPKISARASDDAVLSSQIQARAVTVDRVTYSRHHKRGKPDSMKVEYWCGSFDRYAEWVCFEHQGYPAKKAAQWWSERTAKPVPKTVTEALGHVSQIKTPSRIWVRPNGKYFEIVKVEFDETSKPVDSGSDKRAGNLKFLAA